MLYDLIYRWNLKVKLTETESRMVVARNEGWGKWRDIGQSPNFQ